MWRRLVGTDLEFTAAELIALELAARTADDISALEKILAVNGPTVIGSQGQMRLSPIPGELRLQRLTLARLIGAVAIPAADETVGRSVASRRAQTAAEARWRRQAAQREARRGSPGS